MTLEHDAVKQQDNVLTVAELLFLHISTQNLLCNTNSSARFLRLSKLRQNPLISQAIHTLAAGLIDEFGTDLTHDASGCFNDPEHPLSDGRAG